MISWLLLRGRCRDCQRPSRRGIRSSSWPAPRLFAGTAARFGYRWDLPAFLVLFAGLLALSCIDIERMILPKKIVYPLTVLVAALLLLAAAATGNWHDYLDRRHLRGGLVRRVLRHEPGQSAAARDSETSGCRLVLGLSLGWLGVGYVLLGFFAANLIGAVVGIALIATKHMERQSRMPYGIFLALGCAVAVFAGPELLRPFTHYSF